jgi:enterochelin esterase family protein
MSRLISFALALGSAVAEPAALLSQQGKTTAVTIPSKTYPAGRHAWIYTPAGYPASCQSACNLMIVFDGDSYIDDMQLPHILDSLIAGRHTPPVVAVLFENGDGAARLADLANSARFAGFVANEMLPWSWKNFAVTHSAARTTLAGSSAGGLGAAYIALKYPALFGNVLSQSGAFWRGNEASNSPPYEWLTQEYARSPKVNVRFLLDVGSQETRGALGGAAPAILDANRRLRAVLVQKGYDVQYLEVPNGQHSPESWRTRIAPAIVALAPTLPIRDPHTPVYVSATELPDGAVPRPDADGNYIIGATHRPAFEMVVHEGVPKGAVHLFKMSSADSKIFPGIARDSGTFGTPSQTDPATLIVTTSHPAPYTRTVGVYVPAQYVPGTIAPFIVGADGPDQSLFIALDNLIAEKKVPPMIAISIGNGGGDAQGSERSLEYDTMSGRYAEFIETEVLPLVEWQYNVKLTRDPNLRATMGGSSGGSAAFIMAWYRPDLYRRVLAYSITATNQQWPHNDETPHGAWGFHETLIPNSPAKPIRVWMEVGDQDFLNPNIMRDDMHDWVVASENMAKALAARGYYYQFVFARNALHVDRAVKEQTLPEALEWLWRDQ